jgi:hypothetical protein
MKCPQAELQIQYDVLIAICKPGIRLPAGIGTISKTDKEDSFNKK